MRALVTGATGFLGGALARALAAEGVEVHALRRPTSDPGALGEVAVTWHEGDVTVPASLDGLFSGADLVVHAAGRLGQAGVPESAYRELNVEGTRNVMQAALASPSRPRVLQLSSTGVLGPTGLEPAPEEAPVRPTNPYERSKAQGEAVALEFASRGLPVIVARPGFVYGPGDHHVLGLFRAIERGRFFYIGGGRASCQPTYVEDAVAGMLLCLRRGRPGQIYHVVGAAAATFRELGATMARALGVRAPRLSLPRWAAELGAAGLEGVARVAGGRPPLSRSGVDFFAADRVYSWRKARDELGYAPRHDLADGVGRTVAWYRERGWL
jgi:nucleoside-diphosphate-sugar epimerase